MADIKKMFVQYKGTKAQFEQLANKSEYDKSIVFITGGESGESCIYTRGIYFANAQELVNDLRYISGVIVDGKQYTLPEGGGSVEFAVDKTQGRNTISLDVVNGKLTFALDSSFVSEHDYVVENLGERDAEAGTDTAFARIKAVENILNQLVGDGVEGGIASMIEDAVKDLKDNEIKALSEKDQAIDASMEALAQRVDASLEALVAKDEDVDASIDALQKKDQAIDSSLEALASKDQAIDASMEALAQRVDASLDALVAKDQAIDASMDALQKKDQAIDASMDALAQRVDASLDALVAKDQAIDASMDALAQRVDASLDALVAKDASLDKDIEALQKKDASIDASLQALASKDASIDEVLATKANLDENGKIILTELPDSILGQVIFGGTIDANGNIVATDNFKAVYKAKNGADAPATLPEASKCEGTYFIANASGSAGNVSYNTGDWVISTGSAWVIIDNTDAVTSVADLSGAITATALAKKLSETGDANELALKSEVTEVAGDVADNLEKINGLDASVKALIAKDSDIDASLNALVAKDASHDASLNALAAKDASLDEEIAALVAKDASIDEEIADLKKKDASLDKDIEALQKKDASIDASMEALAQRVDASLDALVAKDASIDEEIADLKKKDASLDSSVADLYTKFWDWEDINA